MDSRAKGARGERDWRDFLRSHGYSEAVRGRQYHGGPDSPDVCCPELAGIHFEVKFVEKLNLRSAMAQAMADAGDKTPVVAHRRNRGEWLITMRAEDWIVSQRKEPNEN